MKKYYAKDNAVASIEVTGGRLTATEKKSIDEILTKLGLAEVTQKKYREIKSVLPPTKKHVSIRVGDDGEIVTKEK